MTQTSTDRIVKEIVLNAPRSRVWRALTKASEFGTWFLVDLNEDFEVGQRVTGQITYPGYEHMKFSLVVERMEAERLFSFRWHPAPHDPDGDYSAEPTTLVEFHLEEAGDGTRLRMIESGFDALPADRREEAFRNNERGWTEQVGNIKRYVEGG